MLLMIHCIKLKKIKWLQSVFFEILFEMKKNHSNQWVKEWGGRDMSRELVRVPS